MEVTTSMGGEETTQRGVHLPYLASLDGLRAIAVVAVLLYHAGLELRGGFLGVEVFFVLSGYLITALLAAELGRHGRINLLRFWARRARRLLPALGLLLLGTLILASLLPRGEAAGLPRDSLAALGYMMNWHLIDQQQSYFDPSLRPPLLQHLWSLAVEEQFYLLWPLAFSLAMRWVRRWGLLLLTIALAGASSALMAGWYQPGADSSRIYYGTDTRLSALLIGAALALVWAPGRVPRPTSRLAGWALDAAGGLALAGLGASFVLLYAQHPRLYRGGFVVVALLTAIVIMAGTHPRAALLQRVLGLAPLRWVGLRSYSLYLWHWPIFMVTRPYVDVPLGGWPLLALRLVATTVLAACSYRLVEQPLRHGAGWPARWLRARLAERPRSGEPIEDLQQRLRGRPFGRQIRRGTLLLLATLLSSSAALFAGARQTTAPALTATQAVPRRESAPTVIAAAPTPRRPAEERPHTPRQAPRAPFDPELASALQALLDEALADGYIPSIALAVSVPGLEPWAGAGGLAALDPPQPMSPQTLVRVASITKMFTAVVVLQLVEEGQLELDAPVERWLPGLLPAGDRTTVRHLLQQTSGLYDYLEDTIYRGEAYEHPTATWTPEEMVAFAVQFESAFEPGAAGEWDYSSTNYVVLGMLVERVTGRSLAQEMRQRIFAPLQLTQTFFLPDETPVGTQAMGYAGGVDQSAVAMSIGFATANLVSSVGDLRRFTVALFGGELLDAKTLALMTTFVDGHGQYNMPDLGYGLGLMHNRLDIGPGPDGQPRSAEARTVWGHTGGFAGFRSTLWYAPESGIAIALSANQSDMDPNTLAADIFATILSAQGR